MYVEDKTEISKAGGKQEDDELTHQDRHHMAQSTEMAALGACTSPANSAGLSKSQTRKNDWELTTAETPQHHRRC